MDGKIVVDGKIVDDEGQKPDKDQTLLDQKIGDIATPEAPKKEDFESEEEFTAALKQHEVDNQEPWQKTDDDITGDVPVGTHIKMKQKLKGRVSERDDEISNLKVEIESLKKGRVTPQATAPSKRPQSEDFDTDEEYETALDKWQDDKADARFEKREIAKKQSEVGRQATENLKVSVDGH